MAKNNDEIRAKATDIMDRQTRQISSLIDDLLDVARIAKAKIALKIETINLYNILCDVCADHREALIRKGIKLSLYSDRKIWIDGDRVRLVQIFGNLLSNACKYSNSGTVRVFAQHTLIVDQPYAVVKISDEGKGMTKELIGKLFEPFTQAEERSEKLNGGLGLGLAIVKGLVELHGGSVYAESLGMNQGSTFTVKLPLTKVPDVTMAREVGDQYPMQTTRKTLQLIDDNADFIATLAGALEFFGHNVVTACNGSMGIEHFMTYRPDAVICDIGLPEVNGYEVVRKLRAIVPSGELLPIFIALSGYGQEADKKKAYDAGFDKHFTKPVDLDVLIDAISR